MWRTAFTCIFLWGRWTYLPTFPLEKIALHPGDTILYAYKISPSGPTLTLTDSFSLQPTGLVVPEVWELPPAGLCRAPSSSLELFDQVLLAFAQEFPCASRAGAFLSLKSVIWTKSCMPFKTGRRSCLYDNRHYAAFRENEKGAVLRDRSHPQHPVPLLNLMVLKSI